MSSFELGWTIIVAVLIIWLIVSVIIDEVRAWQGVKYAIRATWENIKTTAVGVAFLAVIVLVCSVIAWFLGTGINFIVELFKGAGV